MKLKAQKRRNFIKSVAMERHELKTNDPPFHSSRYLPDRFVRLAMFTRLMERARRIRIGI